MDIHEAFIASLIKDPFDTFQKFKARISSKALVDESVEELWPVVEYLLRELQKEDILHLATKDPAVAIARKLALQDLRHISIKNRSFLPYADTIRAIMQCIEFFDICVRCQHLELTGTQLQRFAIEEENPRERSLAYYHRYRYLYHFNSLMNAMPAAFILPTTAGFNMIDMMRFRCVPIYAIGVSTKLTYVDEFEQTPIEFFMHDINHARRQHKATEQWFEANQKNSQEEKNLVYQQSASFSKQLLDSIVVHKNDNEAARAMKNLKKVILFEITHEDAEPFLPEVITNSLQRIEGFASDFEVPSIDPITGLMDVKDTKETGISTLAYVRHKLQNGFYDKIGQEKEGVVSPTYRTTRMIAEAAYELLAEIGAQPNPGVVTDSAGRVDKEWLMARATAYGPEVVHATNIIDPDIQKYGTSKREVNQRTYFEYTKHSQEVTGLIRSRLDHKETRPALAEIRFTADVLLLTKHNSAPHIVLLKRVIPPFEGKFTLPGAFLWEGETALQAAQRALKDKVGNLTIPLFSKALFDAPERDPRGRIVSMVFEGEVSLQDIETICSASETVLKDILFPLHDLPELAFDHLAIIKALTQKR